MATAVVQLTLQIEHLLLAGREGGREWEGGHIGHGRTTALAHGVDSVKCKIFSQRFACSHKDSEEGGERGRERGREWQG